MPIPVEPNPGADSPLARNATLKDFDQARASFSNWQGSIDQLSAGRFSGSLRVLRGNTIRLLEIEGNQQVLLRGRDAGGVFSIYPVTTGNAASTWRGHRLSPGQIVVVGADVEVEHNSARNTHNLGVTIRTTDLQAAAEVLLAVNPERILKSWASLTPSPNVYNRLNRTLNNLLNLCVKDPAILATPEGHRLEQECIQSVVGAVFPAIERHASLSLSGRIRLIRRAEEIMRARLGDPVGAIDLCRELKVSDRTLRLAFREHFGLGPMVFYKSLRLNAVRARLRESPDSSIAEVAHSIGFYHLGNFASDYRRQFGERPSQTDRFDFRIAGIDEMSLSH